MARDISVSIAVQGEKEFNQALKNAQSAVKVLASELKAGEAAFDENADAQAYYTNRTRLINAQIEQEKTILASLEQAVREAANEFGEADAKTDKYRIALNRTYGEMAKLEKALRDTQKEAEELGRDSTRVGRQIENGIGEAAEDAADKLDDMVSQIERDLSDIGSAVEFSAIKDMGEMMIGAFDSLQNFTESSEDYRRQMSFLEQNAKEAGFEFEYVKELLIGVASLTGDLDGAFEAISNLLAAGFDGKELEEAIDLIGGAVIRFPETMKFETLAESLQESVATGQATGTYAELLERLGIDLDEVNKSLEKAENQEQRQQIALAYLNENGLSETVENYKGMNENLLKSEEAQLRYNDSLSRLGEALQPAMLAWTTFKTEFVEGIAELVGAYNEWYEGFQLKNEEIKQIAAGATAEAAEYGSIEEFNDAIAEADAEGAYVRSAALIQAKEKFMKEQTEKRIRELDEEEGKEARTIGENIVTELGNGIAEAELNATNAAQSIWESIREIFMQPITIPAPKIDSDSYNYNGATLKGGGSGTSGVNHIELVAQIEKRTVARAVTDDVSARLGESAAYYSTYG